MKHLDPSQLKPQALAEEPAARISKPVFAIALIGLVLSCGALGTWVFPPDPVDHVSQEQQQSRQSLFAHMPPLAVQVVPENQVGAALDAMKLPAPERSNLESQLHPQQAIPSNSPTAQQPSPAPQAIQPTKLVSVMVWDSDSVDGDVVAIVSGGFRQEVVLAKEPQVVAFPTDGSSTVQIIGIHDGGGGITLGMSGPNNQVLLPIMSEGQTLSLPISY